jgi:hypothetical protein
MCAEHVVMLVHASSRLPVKKLASQMMVGVWF